MIWGWDVIKIVLAGLVSGTVAYFIAKETWRRERDRQKEQARHEVRSQLARHLVLCVEHAEWHIRKHISSRYRYRVRPDDSNPLYLRDASEAEHFARQFVESKASLLEIISRVHTIFPSTQGLAAKARAIEDIQLVRHDICAKGSEPETWDKEALVPWRDSLIVAKLDEVARNIKGPIEALIRFLDTEYLHT